MVIAPFRHVWGLFYDYQLILFACISTSYKKKTKNVLHFGINTRILYSDNNNKIIKIIKKNNMKLQKISNTWHLSINGQVYEHTTISSALTQFQNERKR